METKPHYFLAGSFVIGLLVALFLFLLWMSKDNEHDNYSFYNIYFTGSVAGLERGSAVRFRGIPVGNIADIKVDPTNIERIKVTVRIASDTPIKVDTVAILNYQGITGITYVELIGGTQEAPPLVKKQGEEYAVITSHPSDINRLIESAPRLIEKFTEVADRATRLLGDKNLQAFAESLENYRKLSASIASKTDTINRLITDTAHAAQTISKAADTLGTQLPQTLEQFHHAAEDFSLSSKAIKELVYTNRGQLSTSITDLNTLIRQTNETMRNVNKLTREVSANPSSIIFSKERKGVEVGK
jgi:phospholipid/cholesterol/gamma-HCH transport system substrate-binding protein